MRHLAVEGAGVFWIAAEMAILFLVQWGREHMEERPLQPGLQLSRTSQWRAIGYALLVFVLSAIVARRAVLSLRAPQDPIAFELEHLTLWAQFVTAWVLLEIAIVYHGWRGYRTLRSLLGAPAAPVPKNAAMIAVLFLALSGAASAQLTPIEAALVPYQNALYFYLRVAGVVWIAVEWVAAYLLLRSYALLRSA